MLRRLVAIAVVALLAGAGGVFAFGFLDIAFSLVDNRLGILTGRAIEAVRSHPEGHSNIGTAVAAHASHAAWNAFHGDDDSLGSIVVTARDAGKDPRLAPQWCVELGVDLRSFSFQIQRIAPINLAAQQIAPGLGSQFEILNPYGTSYCAGMADKYRKRT